MMTESAETLFTFVLIDGRRVTYSGRSEKHAFNKAREYHGAAVELIGGTIAKPCACPNKRAESVRQAGFLICRDCAGYIG